MGESFVGEDLNGEGGPTEEVFDVNDSGSSRGVGEGVGSGRVIEGRGSGEDFDAFLLLGRFGADADGEGEDVGRREEEERWGDGDEEDLSTECDKYSNISEYFYECHTLDLRSQLSNGRRPGLIGTLLLLGMKMFPLLQKNCCSFRCELTWWNLDLKTELRQVSLQMWFAFQLQLPSLAAEKDES